MKWFYQRDEIEVGIDEVARGCFLGRVYTGAVVWPYDETSFSNSDTETEKDDNNEVDKETENTLECPITRDSKQYTPDKREELYQYIHDNALEVQYSYCEAEEIDKINILQATYKSMHKSLDQLTTHVDRILVDGDKFKPYTKIDRQGDEEWIPYVCFPKGDTKYLPISAASIVAKVEHDLYIKRLCQEYPELDERYDLSSNMGYGSKRHRDGIAKYGVCQFHRMSFGCCRDRTISPVLSK